MRKAWKNRQREVISPIAFGMSERRFNQQRKHKFLKPIKFSILVPVYNTPREFLEEMIGSALLQTYENWELCIADGSDIEHSYVGEICMELMKKDGRIKYQKLKNNAGISENTNAAVEMATGDYISLLDHDDLLHPSALYETMRKICDDKAEVIYTDEAIFESPDLHNITKMRYKADFSQTLLETVNYVCHFLSFKKELLKGLNFDSECDGAQDYDIILKLAERTTKIAHIRKCLYYWRANQCSTASTSEAKPYTTKAGKKALEKHFIRIGELAEVRLTNAPNNYLIIYADKSKMSELFQHAFRTKIEHVF